MNISQQKAREIARELLQKKLDLRSKLEKEFSEAVRAEYLKTLPKEVILFWNKFKSYAKTTEAVSLRGNGFDFEYVIIEESPSERKHNVCLTPDHKVAEKLLKIKRQYDKIDKEYDEATTKVAATLLSLRSYAKIREYFPEAAELIPEPAKTEIANISEVRKLVK